MEKLNAHQYRMKSTTPEVAEARLMTLFEPHAEYCSKGLAAGLASAMVTRIDAATLGLQRGWMARWLSLDELWKHTCSNLVEIAANPQPTLKNRLDYRLAFGLYRSGNDVLVQDIYFRPSHRRILDTIPQIEPYGLGTPNAPSTPDEQKQRLADWRKARPAQLITICDGILDRPSLDDVAAKVPTLDYRAYVFAVEILSERLGNLTWLDGRGKAEYRAPDAFRDHLQSVEGQAALKTLQDEIKEKLIPTIPVEMLGTPVPLAA
jgi:hypothetical protein